MLKNVAICQNHHVESDKKLHQKHIPFGVMASTSEKLMFPHHDHQYSNKRPQKDQRPKSHCMDGKTWLIWKWELLFEAQTQQSTSFFASENCTWIMLRHIFVYSYHSKILELMMRHHDSQKLNSMIWLLTTSIRRRSRRRGLPCSIQKFRHVQLERFLGQVGGMHIRFFCQFFCEVLNTFTISDACLPVVVWLSRQISKKVSRQKLPRQWTKAHFEGRNSPTNDGPRFLDRKESDAQATWLGIFRHMI